MEKQFHTGLTPYRDTNSKENTDPGYYSPVDFGQFDSNIYASVKTISELDDEDAEEDFHSSPLANRRLMPNKIITEIKPKLNKPLQKATTDAKTIHKQQTLRQIEMFKIALSSSSNFCRFAICLTNYRMH